MSVDARRARAGEDACECDASRTSPGTWDEVLARCAGGDAILRHRAPLAFSPDTWSRAHQCRRCGLVWIAELPFAEQHGGGPASVCLPACADPIAFVGSGRTVTHAIRARHDDRVFFESLGPDVGPQTCRNEHCDARRIVLSAFCRRHHFLNVRGRSFEENADGAQ